MSPPLFILAPPRSFTSVICAMIGNHPEMIGLPETNLFAAATLTELLQISSVRPRFQHGLLRSIAQLGLGGQSNEDVKAAREWLEENRSRTTADVFRDLMEWSEPRGVVDKSPAYLYAPGALERIKTFFPDARFLHLVRHPRATCESIVKLRDDYGGARTGMGGFTGDATLSPEKLWMRPHLRAIEAMEDLPPGNCMTLRGESLMSNPRLYLSQIADWLEIRTDDEAIGAMLHPEQSPFACPGPESAPFGNDPTFLKNPKLRPYQEKAGDLDSPMSWDSTLVFDDVIKHYAMYFGY